jgi:osmoprotectant transport system permease protein
VLVHPLTVAESCLQRNAWICPEYVVTRQDILVDATIDHVYMTFVAVLAGLLIALPLGVLARRSRALELGIVGVATLLYTIPSLAMFVLLLTLGTGLNRTTVIIGLAIYSLAILLRNIITGLEEVPADALDAADGMGLTRWRRLWSVELPLAVPTIIAGVRIATVSTVALVTVGSLIGFGALGDLIFVGLNSAFNAQVLTATVIVVVLALVLDGLLLLAERALTPWARGRAAA